MKDGELNMQDASHRLLSFAERLAWRDLPESVQQHVIDHVVDTLGVMVAGRNAPGSVDVAQEVNNWTGDRAFAFPLLGITSTDLGGALAVGTMTRALDFDDVNETAFVHPAASVVAPSLAALAGSGTVSGDQFLSAVTAGLEWCVRLGLAPTRPPHETGMSHTFHAGLLAGAASAGLIRGLRGEDLRGACGIAYGLLGGNLQALSEGSMAVRLTQGAVAMNALLSVNLAARGLRGPVDILEGKFGYFTTYYRGDYDAGLLRDELGETFHLEGTSLKLYAGAKPVHPAIVAALDLRDSAAVRPAEIAGVTLDVNRFAYEVAGSPLSAKQAPRTTSEMHFSLPWAFAVAFVTGRAGPREFSSEMLSEPAVMQLARKVDVRLDQRFDAESSRTMGPVRATIHTAAGDTVERLVNDVPGRGGRPVERSVLRSKFRACCNLSGISQARADEIFDAVRNLDSCPDVHAWLRELV